MATQWRCFRCGRVNGAQVKFCQCGTPQVADPDPEQYEDNSWIIIVAVAIIVGVAAPFVVYFFL